MPNDPLTELLEPQTPRKRVHSVASRAGISPDVADDYLKVTNVESGHNVNVRDSPKGAQGFGQVMPDVKGGSTRTVGGRRYNLRDPEQNIEAGLRYFAEGGGDPVARRLHYFGGPRARQKYERTGRIPNISDGNMTAAQYVQATGGRRQQQKDPLSELLGSEQIQPPTSRTTATVPAKPRRGQQSAPKTIEEALSSITESANQIAPTVKRKHGIVELGNIDLNNRPRVRNPDGSVSTVRSMSTNIDGREVLIPTVSDDGRILSDREAIEQYKKTGKHLGIFNSPRDATRYARQLHKQQEQMIATRPSRGSNGIGELRRIDDPQAQQMVRGQQQVREDVIKERRGRVGSYGAPTPTGMLHLVSNPVESLTSLFRSEEENVNRETAERLRQRQVASEPEVTEIRKEYGQMPAAVRSVAAPVLGRGGGGLLKTAGGVASLFGIAPNELSEWINKRGEIVETGSALAPLREKNNLTSLITGDKELEEVERGVPEKIATGVADLGVGLGRILLLKKATGLSFPTLMALEGAAVNSDKPLDTRVGKAIEGYALGSALDAHIGRGANAALFGLPTAAQTGYEVSQGRMDPLDAAIQTGIQAGAGAILTPGRKPSGLERGLAREAPREQVEPNAEIAARLRGTSEPQIQTKPPVEAQRETVEPAPRGWGSAPTESDLMAEIAQTYRARPEGGKGKAQALPPLKNGVLPEQVQEAWDVMSARYPRAAQRIKGIAQVEDLYGKSKAVGGHGAKAAIDPNGILWIEKGSRLSIEDAFHEATHATQFARGGIAAAKNPEAEFAAKNRGLQAQRFYHRDFGEVIKTESQEGARAGRTRVQEVNDPEKIHYVKTAQLTGAGNQRMVPVKSEAQPEPNVPRETSRPVDETQPTEPSITSARKEMMKGDRAELDLPELPKAERKSWQQSLDEAQPERATLLADEVLANPRPLNDRDTASLVVRAQQIKNEHASLLKEIGETADSEVIGQKRTRLEALENEFDKLTEATKKSGTEKGRTLAAQKLTINQDFDLVSMKNRLKAAKGESLTEKENAKVEELHARLQKAEADLATANEKLAHRDLQKQIDRVSRRRERQQSKQSLDDEFAALKAQFAKARAEVPRVQASGLAGLDPEGTLTKLIGQMARNRVKAGVTDAAQLVDDIHAAIADSVEGLTKRDVRDVISGYGIEPTGDRRGEDAKRLASIRTELKNLSRQEDVVAGKRLSRQDSTRQKALEKQATDLERRMQTQDFEKPERVKPQYTRETYAKQKAVDELKAEYEKMRYRATRSVMGRIADTAIQAGNVPKTLLSMADLSALLRQGGIGFVQHPVLSTKAAGDMLRSFTEHGFANIENAIKNSPEFESAKRAGVEFTGIDKADPRLSHREEGYLGSNVIDTLAKGRLNPLRVVKGVKDVSERTFVSFLDSQRMRIFEQQSKALRDMGLKGKDLDNALKSQAKYINIITGRGSLGRTGNQAAPALNLAMFSPRLVASRFQFLNKMFNPIAWARMPKGARKLQLIDNAKFLVGTAAVLGLAKAAGASVNTDPDDADFLKIRIGNTRYDTLAGLQQAMRFMIREAKAIKGGETYSGDDKGKILADFSRSKASPETGFVWDYFEGKNRLSGKKFSAGSSAKELIIPLPIKDFREAIKEDGALRGSIESLPALLGIGTQTYKDSAERATTEAEKLARKFVRQRMPPDEGRSEEEIETDKKKSELRARSRLGEDVRGEVKALGSKITERQAKSIIAAHNKTRLEEDTSRLGIKEALLVYSVASPEQRVKLRDLLKRKEKLIEMLPADEREAVRNKWIALGLGSPAIRFARPDREPRAARQ